MHAPVLISSNARISLKASLHNVATMLCCPARCHLHSARPSSIAFCDLASIFFAVSKVDSRTPTAQQRRLTHRTSTGCCTSCIDVEA